MTSERPERSPGHVFVSYVREDTARVDRLVALLERSGIRVWRDTEDLWPGQDWRAEIRAAIRKGALAFLACFSENSERRSDSYQNEELLLAVEQIRLQPRGRTWLIPVRFSDTDIPEIELGPRRTLLDVQHIDLFDDTDWRNATRLIASISAILGGTHPRGRDRVPLPSGDERMTRTEMASSVAGSVLGRAVFAAGTNLVDAVGSRNRASRTAAYSSQVDRTAPGHWPPGLVDRLPAGLTRESLDDFVRTPAFDLCATQRLCWNFHRDRLPTQIRQIHASVQELLVQLVPPKQRNGELRDYAATFVRHFETMCENVHGLLSDSLGRSGTRAGTEAISDTVIDVMGTLDRYTQVITESERTPGDRDAWRTSYVTAFLASTELIELPDLDGRTRRSYEQLFTFPTVLRGSYETLNALRVTGSTLAHVEELGLDVFTDQLRRAVLLGDPGAGKTTSGTAIMRQQWSRVGRTPFIVYIRDLRRSNFNLVDLLHERLVTRFELRPSKRSLERLLLEGNCAILFDGLDENQHDTDRRELADQIEMFTHRYPRIRVLVTCRYVGYQVARPDEARFDEFAIGRFGEEQIVTYARQWFAAKNGRVEEAELGDFLRSARSMLDLVSNPLLLAFILLMYNGRKEIPRTRPTLYRQCVDLLLGEWDQRRRIVRGLPDRELVRTALARIAHLEKERGSAREGMTAPELTEDLVPFLSDRVIPGRQQSERFVTELVELCRGRAWIFTDVGKRELDGEDLFSFTHASFQEYFLATWSVRTRRDHDGLLRELWSFAVSGTNEIYAQVCLHLIEQGELSGASHVLLALMDELEREHPIVPAQDGSVRLGRLGPAAQHERSTALVFLARASDTVPLSRTAAERLISLAVKQIGVGDISPLTVLMEETYNHRESVFSILDHAIEEALRDPDHTAGLPYLWFAANVGFLAQYMAERLDPTTVKQLRSIAAAATPHLNSDEPHHGARFALSVIGGKQPVFHGLSSDLAFAATIEEYFSGFSRPISGFGPTSIADWVLGCLEADSRSVLPLASVGELLRAVARGVRAHDTLLPLFDLPEVGGLEMSANVLHDMLDRVFRRALPYDEDFRLGITFIAAAAIDFAEATGTRDRDLRLLFGRWLAGSRVDHDYPKIITDWQLGRPLWSRGWSQEVS